MYRTGDIVTRVAVASEGNFKKGTRAIVKEVLNDTEFTLEGHEGIYLQASFRISKLTTEVHQNRQVSDLESLENALKVIDNWNRTKPTSQMISVEAYPAQDGGSLFTTPSFDSNSISDFIVHLLGYGSDIDKAAALERAAQALRFGA